MNRSQSSALVDEMLSHLEANFVDYEKSSQVANFYANKSVFITGATGFIGKAVVEKLVRSCKDIKRIYLLIREKRGKDVKDRLSELTQSRIFDRIKAHPNGRKELEEKLCPIRGDITLSRFGVCEEDMEELAREVSIVFNSAATIRFSEPIDVAVVNNISSVENLVHFCDCLRNLQAIIHLSTAYSNCHKRDTIYETFYEPPMRGKHILGAIEQLKRAESTIHEYPSRQSVSRDERSACQLQQFYPPSDTCRRADDEEGSELLESFAEIALRKSNRPNTYTFTKAISESYLCELVSERQERYLGRGRIPVSIIRPSVVCGALREPQVGYVDNFNGATGAILSLYTGALQAMPGNGRLVADLVPVDLVVNMVICAGWFLVEREQSSDANNLLQVEPDRGVYIFNFVSGCRNALRWHQVTDKIAKMAYKYPSGNLVRLPSSFFIAAGQLYDLYDALNHKLPAWLADFALYLRTRSWPTGRQSRLAGYQKIRAMTSTLTPFTSNHWRLDDSNTRALYEQLSDSDRRLFGFDVSQIDWSDYIGKYIIGSRIYTMKDEPHSLAKGMKFVRKLESALLTWLGLSDE